MSSPYDLLGSSNSSSSFKLSTDYTGGSSLSAAQQIANVTPVESPEVNPAYKGNYGRKAAMFGNFRNPVQAQGTFFPSDEEPFEIPHSDPGSDYARGF